MSAPTWPQLAGWLATAGTPALQGRLAVRGTPGVLTEDVRVARDGDEVRLDLPDRRVVLSGPRGTSTIASDGQLEPGFGRIPKEIDGLLRTHGGWERGDFHRALGPVREVEVAGRLGWEAALEAPRRKVGPLVLVVDDETGILLAYRNQHPEQGWSAEFRALDLTAPAPEVFVHHGFRSPDGPAAAVERRRVLDEFAATLPRVRNWPPGFLPSVRPPRADATVVHISPGSAHVRLARARDEAALPDPWELPVRWRRDGWSYAMDLNGHDFSEDELRRIQDSVVERLVD